MSDAAQLAGGILDDGMKMMALAGIMAFLISNIKYRSRKMRRSIMLAEIDKIIEMEKQYAVERAVRKNTIEVTKQVTKQVIFNLIFDLVNTGNLNREEAMRRLELSDDEFRVQLEKYRQAHRENAVKI